MPLPERSGAVAMPAQDLGNRGGLSGDGAVVTGKAIGDLGDATHVHGVMISAGEEGCAGRGAERRGVELVVAKPGTGDSVDGWRGHGATEGAAGAESDVIEQDQHDVGCVDRGPVCAERYRF